MAEDKSSKKHPATPHKKKEARRKGNVAKSQDVGVVIGLVAGFGVVVAMRKFYLREMKEAMTEPISRIAEVPELADEDILGFIGQLMLFVLKQVAFLSLPVLCGVLVFAVIAQFAQVGVIVTGEQLKPKLSKINPMKGIKKWFAIKSLVELGKSLAKIAVALSIGAWVLWGEIETIAASVFGTPEQLVTVTGGIISSMVWKVVGLLVVIAIIDLMFQRWQWARDLKMSDKEVKDEYKQQEGDPYQKQRRRQIHQQMLQEQATDNVPQSDVVVINPTDYAVALKYDVDLSPVPFVLAKGEARQADAIRESARNNGVPVVRNKPLARALHELCEIGDIVPGDLYKAVAEVLAYVFALKQQDPAAATAEPAAAAVGSAPATASPHVTAGDTSHA